MILQRRVSVPVMLIKVLPVCSLLLHMYTYLTSLTINSLVHDVTIAKKAFTLSVNTLAMLVACVVVAPNG